jgi:hypothetical protein
MAPLERIRAQLRDVLNRHAPRGAVSGEWTQTTFQAGVASGSGGFQNARGDWLDTPDKVSDAITAAADALAAEPPNWNVMHVAWSAAVGDVMLRLEFDPSIVPRRVDDPIYAQAESTRRSFWEQVGAVSPDCLGSTYDANAYAQTRWLSPHRRLLLVQREADAILTTDGLSTPWPGVADSVNGCGLEVYFSLDHDQTEPLDRWVEVLLSIGDMVADDGGVGCEFEGEQAIVFCKLPEAFAPLTHVIFSAPQTLGHAVIEDMPFGSVRLVEATAVSADDLKGVAEESAFEVLRRRRAARSGS